jgi:hypothetical protein
VNVARLGAQALEIKKVLKENRSVYRVEIERKKSLTMRAC